MRVNIAKKFEELQKILLFLLFFGVIVAKAEAEQIKTEQIELKCLYFNHKPKLALILCSYKDQPIGFIVEPGFIAEPGELKCTIDARKETLQCGKYKLVKLLEDVGEINLKLEVIQ